MSGLESAAASFDILPTCRKIHHRSLPIGGAPLVLNHNAHPVTGDRP
jgi:hypothetical protein